MRQLFSQYWGKKTVKYYLDKQTSLIQEYNAKGVQLRLIDEYKGMAIYEVPASQVIDE